MATALALPLILTDRPLHLRVTEASPRRSRASTRSQPLQKPSAAVGSLGVSVGNDTNVGIKTDAPTRSVRRQ